jgi:hypothetical protein
MVLVLSSISRTVIPTGAELLDFARGRLREAQWRDLVKRRGGPSTARFALRSG